VESEEIEDLVRRSVAGDPLAAGTLARRYEGAVRRAISRELGPSLRRLADTDDLLQSTLLAAFEGLSGFTYRGERALLAWLKSIASQRIRLSARLHHRQKRDLDRDVPLDAVGEPVADQTSPGDRAARNELTDWIRREMEHLPPKEREVVDLHTFRGMSFQEVARAMGLPGKRSAHHIFHRALDRMAGTIESGEG
jgi:RNA polymerase sigma-70 factor (ECF subfamily)